MKEIKVFISQSLLLGYFSILSSTFIIILSGMIVQDIDLVLLIPLMVLFIMELIVPLFTSKTLIEHLLDGAGIK